MKPHSVSALHVALLCLALSSLSSAWETGDIIFQQSRSAQSQVIQQVTKSRYSHMGMLVRRNGQTYVLEAVQPVTLTPIKPFIERGEDGHYVIKRLRPQYTPNTSQKAEMARLAKTWMGRNYDLVFGWSDSQMYCSELVWKIYKRGAGVRIGELETFGDLDLSAKATQVLIEQRTDSVDLTERIITPEAMFNSEKLVTIAEHPKK